MDFSIFLVITLKKHTHVIHFYDWHIVNKEKHNFSELATHLTKLKAGIVAKHLLISFICIISAQHLHKGKHIMRQEVMRFLCRCTDYLKYKKINEKEGEVDK